MMQGVHHIVHIKVWNNGNNKYDINIFALQNRLTNALRKTYFPFGYAMHFKCSKEMNECKQNLSQFTLVWIVGSHDGMQRLSCALPSIPLIALGISYSLMQRVIQTKKHSQRR